MKISLFVICALILCSSLYGEAKRLPTKVNSDLNCQICELIVTVVEQLIPKGETPDQMVKSLEKICAALPSHQVECKLIVDTYGRKIITELINKAPAQNVCRDLTLCPKSLVHYNAVQIPTKENKYPMILSGPNTPKFEKKKSINEPTGDKKPASVPCEVCKLVMAEAEKFIKANSSEQQIKKALEQACSALPKTVQAICVAFVDTYESQIVELLIKQLPPSQICASLGLCKKVVMVPPTTNNEIECEVCQFVLGEIEKYIQGNSTEHQITAIVEQVCTFLPKSYGGICKAFIDQYAKQIIEALVDKFPPRTICQQIGLCKKNSADKIKSNNAVVCAVCKYIVVEIEKYVGQNSSESQIIHTVEKICSHLPLTIKNTCDAFIEQYGPTIIEYLINKYPADLICGAMGLCNKTHIKRVPPVKQFENPIYCTVCKLVLTEAEKFISQNSTEQEIITALEKACAQLPKSYAPVCVAFVDQYGPEVIQLLLNKFPPNQICAQIGLCKNATFVSQVISKPMKAKSVLCTACEYILIEIDKYLAENATEREIISVIEHICNLLPLKMQPVCDAFIEEYGISIINLLVNKMQPEQVCKAMKLCTNDKGTPHITKINLFNGKRKFPVV
jgi:saposin